MKRLAAVTLGAVALVGYSARAGMYVGIESRAQAAELEIEKATEEGIDTTAQMQSLVDEAIGRNSINAIRVGYVAETGGGLLIDANVAFGSVSHSGAARVPGPVTGWIPAGEEMILGGCNLDSSLYMDFGAGVRGKAGNLSYTGGFRYEFSSFEEDTFDEDESVRETNELDQSCIAIEGTVGFGEDVRGFVGVGYNIYSSEDTEKDGGVVVQVVEFTYAMPLVVFAGVELRAEKVNAFARVSLMGEKFLSTWAGVAVKF